MTTTRSPRRGDTALGRDKLSPMERLGIFAGLAAAPFVAYVVSFLIHLYVAGGEWGPIHVPGNPYILTVTVLILGAFGWWLGVAALHFADHRTRFVRLTLCWSARVVTWMFAATVAIGLHRWLALAFILTGWMVAVTWSMARLDATRKEEKTGDGESKQPKWLDALDGWDGKVVQQEHDDKGRLVRSVIRFKHAPGATVDALQGVLRNIESHVGVVAKMSRAVGGDKASESELTVMHRDPLDDFLPMRPLRHRGETIAPPVVFAKYDDNCDVACLLGGGRGFSQSGYMFMGVSRSGKTVAENQLLTDLGSRRGVVFLYLNQAKGKQDLRPVSPIVEVAVVAEDESDSIKQYEYAFQMVKRIIMRRSQILAQFGIQEWSPRTCFDEAHKQVRADGQPGRLEPMPALILHVGEADSILESGRADELATFIASKGLSTGVVPGWSLQRADASKMPTGLRYNIGTVWCFGTGDSYSAGFALPDSVIKAGADPEWGATKPGSHYFVGLGIPERDFPKRAKTEFLAPGVDEDDDFDDIKRAFQEELLKRNKESAATTLAVLDRASAEATRNPNGIVWWDMMAGATDALRSQLGGDGPRRHTSQATPASSQPASSQGTGEDMFGRKSQASSQAPAFELDDMEVGGHELYGADVRAEMADVTEVEGVELYPESDADLGIDREPLDVPIAPPATGTEDVAWEDDSPVAPDRQTAIRMLHEGLRAMAVADDLPEDPVVPGSKLIQMNHIVERYTFKKKPWFYPVVTQIVEEGGGEGYTLEHLEEFGTRPRVYRLKLHAE